MTGPIQGTLFSNKDRTIMLKKIFKPSQWINLGYVIFGIGASPFTMGITLIIPAWKMLETYCTSYEFHQDRIIYRRGVLSVTTDEILIHRIKSINLHEPFLYRLVGISNLRVISSDQFIPQMELTGIPVGREIMDVLREMVERNRQIKGTKEFDLYNM